MNPPRVVIWNDFHTYQRIVRLESDERFVQQPITYEELEDTDDTHEFMQRTLLKLCIKWQETYGGHPLVIAPKSEATVWSVYYDNTIDGEVVVKEIERTTKAIEGSTGATRGCIEGR